MFKDGRYINAGTNEFYRWGHKAVEKASVSLTANDSGYYSIPADGGKYWTFGTSEGKYGEYARWNDACFSVNKGGYIYAKSGTEKGEKFVEMITWLIKSMEEKHAESAESQDD